MNNKKGRIKVEISEKLYLIFSFILTFYGLIQFLRGQGWIYFFFFIGCFGPLMLFALWVYDDKKKEGEKNGRTQNKENIKRH